MEWLILVYKMPPEPSRYRVALWRSLREIGAVYVQNSVCVLPDFPEHREKFQEFSRKIVEYGGESILFSAQGLDENEDGKIVARFNAERDLEYREVVEECLSFLKEIEKETEAKNFIFAELEENEGNLQRLSAWAAKVKKRDFFGAPMRDEAETMLSRCQEALEGFASRIYQAEGEIQSK